MRNFNYNLEQGSPAWHLWRKGGVNGSDVSAIFGVSPYKTKRDYWMEKAEKVMPKEINQYIANKGHAVEEELRLYYKEKLGMDFTPVCVSYADILNCSLDGWNQDTMTMVEFKLVGMKEIRKIEKGEIPVHHNYQVHANMLASGAKKAIYCAGAEDEEGNLITFSVNVEPDYYLQDDIFRECVDFSESLKKGEAPPITAKDTFFITEYDYFSKLEAMHLISNKIKALKEQYDNLKDEVLSSLPHDKVDCGGHKITRYEVKGSVDYKKIPELDGVNIEDYRGKPSKRTKITFKGEE